MATRAPESPPLASRNLFDEYAVITTVRGVCVERPPSFLTGVIYMLHCAARPRLAPAFR
jgi:hypothetical protein